MPRIRFRRGTALVASVLKKFDRAIEDLGVASEQIQTQRAQNFAGIQATQERVRQLEAQHYAEDALLLDAYKRAEKVRTNIAALVAG